MLMTNVQLVAVDVDGTLTEPNLALDLTAVKVIRELGKKVYVALVTGNAFPIAESIFRYVKPGRTPLLIAENGGVIVAGKIMRKFSDPELMKGVVEYLKARGHDELISEDFHLRTSDLALRGDESTLRELELELRRVFPEAVIRYSGYALHIMPRGVTKGRGLRELCKLLKISCSRVVAIGDSYNDIDMFEVSGFSIALPQAPDEVKKRVNFVAPGKGYGESLTLALAVILNSL